MIQSRGLLLGLMALATMLDRLLHEGEEERAGVKYRAAVLRVVLHADIPRVAAELYRLDEPRVRVLPCTNHASCFVSLAILAVELEAVAVTLTDEVRAIGGSDL